ncbi:MAG: hypothetical protein IIA82_06825 [Thaumarchaeota archaeon]|nr:hypothetical protein [Nitrososphaerota archaeon]
MGTQILHYEIGFGKPIPEEKWLVKFAQSENDSRQIYGVVKTPSGETLEFTYRDVGEITFGMILLVISVSAAVLCGGALLIGYLRTKECKNIHVDYGIDFNWNQGFKTRCKVTCLD